ncbi:MAG: hypothetical protein HC919_11725 [Oscillatoriales cyanobacterium SM2_2_1]|nr:hypothetical protein [Oscillatoriales cyanobacterium SM2_2_1]
MDETEIAKGLQTELISYRVKAQVRQKGSQLHVLVTRAAERQVNYAEVFEIVKVSLERMPLQDTDKFVFYGRVSGSKEPEWQKVGDIKPNLPAIEFDMAPADEMRIVDLSDLEMVPTPFSTVPQSRPEPIAAAARSGEEPRAELNHALRSTPEINNNHRPPTAVTPKRRSQGEAVKPSDTKSSSLLLPIGVLIVVTAAVGGGWLWWDLSQQEGLLQQVRVAEAAIAPAEKATSLDELTKGQQGLEQAIAQLSSIPDRPGSLRPEADTELKKLQGRLEAYRQRLQAESPAQERFQKSLNLVREAAIQVQNPPHNAKVWTDAQSKRQESLNLLRAIPPESILYGEAQRRIQIYAPELQQTTAQLQRQLRVQRALRSVSPQTTSSLRSLKQKGSPAAQFNATCVPLVVREVTPATIQSLGFQPSPFGALMCNYLFKSL